MRKPWEAFLVPFFTLIIIPAIGTVILVFRGTVYSPLYPDLKRNEYHQTTLCWNDGYEHTDKYILVSEEYFDAGVIIRKINEKPERINRFDLRSCENDEATVDGLPCNRKYYYAVIEKKSIFGREFYVARNETSFFVSAPFTVPRVYIMKAREITDSTVHLDWKMPLHYYHNIDGSEVRYEYELSLVTQGEQPLKVQARETECTVEGLTPFVSYDVQIAVSAFADGQKFTAFYDGLRQFHTLPHPVRNLKASAAGQKAIELKWDKYEDHDDAVYEIFGSNKKEGPYKLLASQGTNTYKESGLSAGTTRYYYVTVTMKDGDREYTSDTGETVKATTAKPSRRSSGYYSPGSVSVNPNLSKSAQARQVARQIARSIGGSNDGERIAQAAYIVSQYCRNGRYTTSGSDYSQAYGVFIKGEYSCAGATRALGMVLEEMGYSWRHANANSWSHQWCIVTMDGQRGWADGQLGLAGYGSHPYE